MPIYEYFCPNCKLKFELLRPLSQSNETASCPHCHNGTERIFSSFASFSKSSEGVSTPIGGDSPCSTCSAISCAACKGSAIDD
jgi:putative FmdB family regulatory protein